LYTSAGIRPDPQKIADLKSMPTPKNKDELQRFLGLITYLSTYVPNFSSKASPLRELIKKDTPFVCDEDHQKIYDDLKHSMSPDTCLGYFDPTKPTMLEVDASQKGL
jgi:hypothetical protein